MRKKKKSVLPTRIRWSPELIQALPKPWKSVLSFGHYTYIPSIGQNVVTAGYRRFPCKMFVEFRPQQLHNVKSINRFHKGYCAFVSKI